VWVIFVQWQLVSLIGVGHRARGCYFVVWMTCYMESALVPDMRECILIVYYCVQGVGRCTCPVASVIVVRGVLVTSPKVS